MAVSRKYLINFAINAIIISLAFMLYEYVSLRSLPTSYWFEYESVEPTKSEYTIGEDLTILSTSTITRDVDIYWNDVLRCWNNKKVQYYSNYESSYYSTSRPEEVTEWVYGGPTPTTRKDCFLESTITGKVGYGIEKIQKITSGPFRFITK